MVEKERFGRFLRSLLGALTVAWLAVALAAPPDPFTFLLGLVPAWVLGTAVAAWLVYGDGWQRLSASGLFRPALRTSTATLAFVLVAVALKVAATAAANAALGASSVGYTVGVGTSAVAVLLAYAAVFLTGPDIRPGELDDRSESDRGQ